MKDCDEARVCLGIEIHRDRKNKKLFINQARYIQKVLERFKMTDCKPVVTPMDGQFTAADLTASRFDPKIYQQLVGCAMYLSVGSRPDISFTVSRLAQYVQAPTERLWTAAERLLRYISGTKLEGIVYDGSKNIHPVGYSDFDWGGCKVERKSTSGFIFLMAGGAVSWKSKKQGPVAQSSAEAEYMALAAAASEAIWLSNIYGFTQVSKNTSLIEVMADNQGAIKMARNDSSGVRTKHIDIKYHFVRDSIAAKLFRIDYCPTTDMAADILTKPLERVLLNRHTGTLGVTALPRIDGLGLRGTVRDK